jgi:riboflavin synthase
VPPRGRAGQLVVEAATVLEDAHLGDSIAVNGVCLTVTRLPGGAFAADVMPETLGRSNLGALVPGSPVNLERAMAANGRFGGHIVSGHIDGTGRIAARTADQNAVRLRVACSPAVAALVIEKGSVAIDGVSLTVTARSRDGFEVSVIPHTGSATTVLAKRVGDEVNLENDVIGKYVQRLMEEGARASPQEGSQDLTMSYLRERGF